MGEGQAEVDRKRSVRPRNFRMQAGVLIGSRRTCAFADLVSDSHLFNADQSVSGIGWPLRTIVGYTLSKPLWSVAL